MPQRKAINWREKKGQLMQKLAKLTDHDKLLAEGKMEEVLGRLEIRLGQTKAALRKLISKL